MEPLKIEQNLQLERLLLSDPDMEKRVQKIIRSVLSKARTRLSADIRPALGADPRQAYKAVRRSVYKQVLGGNLNILQGRAKGGSLSPNPSPIRRGADRTGKRGGNRRPRSARTDQVDSYTGADRGFILRFLNSGTDNRTTRYGNRGSITARNFLAQAGIQEMNQAAEELARLIEQEINNTQQ